MNFPSKGKNASRNLSSKKLHSGSRSRSASKSPRSRSLSPRGRRRSRISKSDRGSGAGKRSHLRPNKRAFSRSLSRSPTSSSSSSSSSSRSRSRSYSSYSRSSSSRSSSSSSSSFSSSSLESVRSSYRKRPYSRVTKSWSRSPPAVPRFAPKIKATSLSKAVQSVHSIKEKKFLKTVPGSDLPPERVIANTSTVKTKTKAKLKPREVAEPPLHQLHGPSLSAPGNSGLPSVNSGDFYAKEVVNLNNNNNNKTLPFVEAVDKASFKKMDVRRGPETQYFKGATQLSREVNTNHATSPHSDGGQSNSDSSTDDEDGPMKMTLSERFGKLAQLSSQRQEYDGVRMKIVREGGQDKKVYLERDSRSSTPRGRRSSRAHERWLREHKEEYDEYEERYGEFRHWDPHRDLPRELPPNWDDVNVRYRYYKESGYFGERSITMEDYLKWEEWWYRYRDWLEKYGGSQEEPRKYRGAYAYEPARVPARDRWIRREKDERKRHRY